MPVYEIASWTGSDALISDKDILKPAFDEMSKTEGYIRYVNFFFSQICGGCSPCPPLEHIMELQKSNRRRSLLSLVSLL